MSKFFKILFKVFLIAVIIYSLYSIICFIVSWNYEPDDQIIDNPILTSGIETIILGSEKELPSEYWLPEYEKSKVKVYVTFNEDVLSVWLLDFEISERFLHQEIKIRPSGYSLLSKRGRLSFISPIGPHNFYIKSAVSLREDNLLKIKLGISRRIDITSIIMLVTMIGLIILILKTPNQEKKIEVIKTILNKKKVLS